MAINMVDMEALLWGRNIVSVSTGVSVVNFNVDLQPIHGCQKSKKFYGDIKAALYSSNKGSTGSSDSSTNGVYVKLTVTPHSDTSVVAISDSLSMKVQVGGKFFEEGWKRYKEPVNIKVEFDLPTTAEKLILVSKDLRLPLDLTENGYTFENQVEEKWAKYFKCPSYYGCGQVTIQLLEGKPPSSVDVVEVTKKILDDKIQCDFALIAKNKKLVSCHTNFLAARSEVFKKMFEANGKEAKKTHEMDLTEEAVNALLKFLYCSTLDDAISSSISMELLQTAREYDIPSLGKALKSIFIAKPSGWYDLKVAMALFQYASKFYYCHHLQEKAVSVIHSKPEQLRASTAYEDLFRKDPETAKKLFLLCLRRRR